MLKTSTSQTWQVQTADGVSLQATPNNMALLRTATAREFSLPLTSLIGREQDINHILAWLSRPQVRLLSLIGPPGVGKTRLAQELATLTEESFDQGAHFVSLSSVFDPTQVMMAIARAVRLSGKDTITPLERLKIFFDQKQALLVIDNFEQILPAAPQLVDLLTACPDLKIVVTSRAALQIRGEYEFVVRALDLPDAQTYRSPEDLAHISSVALFLQRVEAVKPEFRLTEGNVPLVSRLCQQLEGIPLAIELAAARCKVLSLQAISSRLEQGIAVLSGNRQDAPIHHHSLHDTINWSYQLLSPDEQSLFRRLSVFVGEFTLTAAENFSEMVGPLSLPVLDGIASLVDKSLLQQHIVEGSDPLLHKLHAIRQFGLKLLEVHDELAECREAHATYYLQLAEQAGKAWYGPEETRWLHILQQQYANILAAHAFFQQQHRSEELARLTVAMGPFWFYRGYLNEGRSYLEYVLALDVTAEAAISPTIRASALFLAGLIAFWQNDYLQACFWIEECEQIYRQQGELHGLARALLLLGLVKRTPGSEQESIAIHQECLQLCQSTGNKLGIAEILNVQGVNAFISEDYERAKQLLAEGQMLAREIGCGYTLAQNLYFMGKMAFVQEEYEKARQFSKESLRLFEVYDLPIHIPKGMTLLALVFILGGDEKEATALLNKAFIRSEEIQDQEDKAAVLFSQGFLALAQKEFNRARLLFEESMRILLPINVQKVGLNAWVLPANLEGLGIVAFEQGNLKAYVKLFSMADATRQSMPFDTAFNPCHALYRRLMDKVKLALGKHGFVTAWAEGQAIPLQQASKLLSLKIDVTDSPLVKSAPAPALAKNLLMGTEVLSQREVEVLRLIAQGLTNSEIADQLILSPHTVNRHTQSIYRKLDIKSRSAATRYALEHHLV